MPKYLSHIKKDIDAEYSYIRAQGLQASSHTSFRRFHSLCRLQEAREQEEAARMRPLEEEEREDLIEGLKSKWEQAR